MNFKLGDNIMPFMCTSSTRKGGGGKGQPVKIITDNSIETVVFGTLRWIMTLTMPFKSKLSPHRHRVVWDRNMHVHWHWERKAASLWDIKTIFCNLVTSKGELIEKVFPLGMMWMKFEGMTFKKSRRPTLVSNHSFWNSWYQ